MSDQIEKKIDLKAPVSRVWRALTDHEQFGEWFQVKLDGPFAEGKLIRGKLTFPGYEGKGLEITIQKIHPETLFSYTWHPHSTDPSVDYSNEVPTLVEFRLEPVTGGTRLTVTESGFDKIPASRRDEALRANEGGWAYQIQSIETYVTQKP